MSVLDAGMGGHWNSIPIARDFSNGIREYSSICDQFRIKSTWQGQRQGMDHCHQTRSCGLGHEDQVPWGSLFSLPNMFSEMTVFLEDIPQDEWFEDHVCTECSWAGQQTRVKPLRTPVVTQVWVSLFQRSLCCHPSGYHFGQNFHCLCEERLWGNKIGKRHPVPYQVVGQCAAVPLCPIPS